MKDTKQREIVDDCIFQCDVLDACIYGALKIVEEAEYDNLANGLIIQWTKARKAIDKLIELKSQKSDKDSSSGE